MEMNTYNKQAIEFLKNCNAKMTIKYLYCTQNKDWSDKYSRNTYRVTIRTPRGTMSIKFWDSVYNTRNGEEPCEYDILASLQKYDVGTIDDFVSEYGYEVTCWEDVRRIERIYRACRNEYKKVCRCFTEEQIEALRDIE